MLLLVQLSGCGWRLRGSVDLPASIETVYLTGVARYSELGNAIYNAFAGTNSTLVSSPAQAKATLHILSDKAEKRILATDSTGRASEYEVTYVLQIKLLDHEGKTLIEEQSVRAKREYRFDPANVLASDSQVARLQKEMVGFSVQQMLLRINAGLRSKAAGG